jgi:hypothetical protein
MPALHEIFTTTLGGSKRLPALAAGAELHVVLSGLCNPSEESL